MRRQSTCGRCKGKGQTSRFEGFHLAAARPFEKAQQPRNAALYLNSISQIIAKAASCVNRQYIMFYKLTSARGAGKMRECTYIIINAMIPAAVVLFIDTIRQGWVQGERPELLCTDK